MSGTPPPVDPGEANRGKRASVAPDGSVSGSGAGAGGGGTPEDIDSDSASGAGGGPLFYCVDPASLPRVA
jgi:hypothetical protein